MDRKREVENRKRPPPNTNKGGKTDLVLEDEVAKTDPEAGEAEFEPKKIECKRLINGVDGIVRERVVVVSGSTVVGVEVVVVEVGSEVVVGVEVEAMSVGEGEGKLIRNEIGVVQSAEESAELV